MNFVSLVFSELNGATILQPHNFNYTRSIIITTMGQRHQCLFTTHTALTAGR